MTFELFMGLLTIGSVGSGFVTEAVKKYCNNREIKYKSNEVAFINSMIFGLGGGIIGYLVNGVAFNATNIALIIPLILCNWIGCTIGYDKVIQTIKQRRKIKGL